jgi:hypothetical protein
MVEAGLKEQGRSFVSNDCFIGDQERVWFITGWVAYKLVVGRPEADSDTGQTWLGKVRSYGRML